MFGITFWLIVIAVIFFRVPENREKIKRYLQNHPKLTELVRPPAVYALIFVFVLLYIFGGMFLVLIVGVLFFRSLPYIERNKIIKSGGDLLMQGVKKSEKKESSQQNAKAKVVDVSSPRMSTTSFIPSSPMNFGLIKKVMYWMIAGFVVLFFLAQGLPRYTVSPGEIALITRFGKLQDDYATEGLNFKIPLIDKVVRINIQTQKVEATANAASKDLQNISATIAVNGSVQPASAKELYRNLGDASLVADKIINPSIQESVKAATAKYTAEELITKRTAVSQDIRVLLVEKLERWGIQVSDVNIVNFQFSADFDAAIEKKVKAEQEALAEKNKLESVKFQAQQSIERSKAEAESIRIQAEAIKSQGGQEYVNLKWIEKWDGKLPQTSLGSSNGLILNLKQ